MVRDERTNSSSNNSSNNNNDTSTRSEVGGGTAMMTATTTRPAWVGVGVEGERLVDPGPRARAGAPARSKLYSAAGGVFLVCLES